MDTDPYDWMAWIDGTDCRLLLLALAHAVNDDGCALDDLRAMVDGWRANADRALTADDWRAEVDAYLGVTADARFLVLSRAAWGERNEGRNDGE